MMNNVLPVDGIGNLLDPPLGQVPGGEWDTQAAVFEEIYLVFLILGTIVGVVVISYMLYNAIKYRDDGSDDDDGADRPTMGELPTGAGGGRKLFLSFGISAIIVVGLVAWTYGALLVVEAGPPDVEENDDLEGTMEIRVEGFTFGWEFYYPNGESTINELRVPEGYVIELSITSQDVFHNFGSPDLRIKADAIPGQTTDTWFIAEEQGEYHAACYELCGSGHSYMTADIIVMEEGEFDDWYEDMGDNGTEENGTDENGTDQNGSNENGTEDDSETHRVAA